VIAFQLHFSKLFKNKSGSIMPNNLLDDLAQICIKKSLKIATAESCTGGGVAYQITEKPGSSQWFERGFVTYSNLAKIEMLGVSEQTITTFGAVSQEVAEEMAEGALRYSDANVTLAITGIAGPDGGTAEKPVGTCWFAWASQYFETHSERKIFSNDRQAVREQAIIFSLEYLLHLLNKEI
jgi:nicotinamide-nucleotide amidase